MVLNPISGVTQGSVLRPLFIIHINDPDKGVSGDVNKFTYDGKINRFIRSDLDVIALQADLNRINE